MPTGSIDVVMCAVSDIPTPVLEISPIYIDKRSVRRLGSPDSDRVLCARRRESRDIEPATESVAIPKVVPTIVIVHITAFLGLGEDWVEGKLSVFGADDCGEVLDQIVLVYV